VTDIRIKRTAELSLDGYRWWLQRRWGDGPVVCFVMLNPSVADAERDDPTIKRCIAFAQALGFGALSVRNLYPFRATDPKDLTKAIMAGVNVRGGERGNSELAAARSADLVVAAWGAYPCTQRAREFLDMMSQKPVWCIRKNDSGSPVHPLYQKVTDSPASFYRCDK